MNRGKATAPLAMRATVEALHSLHEHVIVLSLDSLPVPRVPDSKRLDIDELTYTDDGITFVGVKYGYFEEFDVPATLRLIEQAGVESPLEVDEALFFLSKIELKISTKPGMSRLRKELFLATSLISAEPAEYFRLPPERTVILGAQIEF
jgi:KUP system potassium uptake protein